MPSNATGTMKPPDKTAGNVPYTLILPMVAIPVSLAHDSFHHFCKTTLCQTTLSLAVLPKLTIKNQRNLWHWLWPGRDFGYIKPQTTKRESWWAHNIKKMGHSAVGYSNSLNDDDWAHKQKNGSKPNILNSLQLKRGHLASSFTSLQ